MADVFRGKNGALSRASLFGYGFHGITAIVALWMFAQALGV